MLLPVSSLGDLERGHTSQSEAGYSLLDPHILLMSSKHEARTWVGAIRKPRAQHIRKSGLLSFAEVPLSQTSTNYNVSYLNP